MADNSDLKLKYTVQVLKEGTGAKDAAADFEKLGASAGKADSSMGGMAVGALKAVKAFAALVVVQQIVGFLTESVRAFEAADKAAKQLDGTLRALGSYTPQLSGYLKQLANDLEDSTKVDDKEILGAISTLMRMGATAETVGPMVQRALDISADGTTSLASASEALGRAMQGEFGTIGRVIGKRFEEDAGRAENYAEAIRLVDERFRGLAAATAASDNSLKGMSHQWGELKENFGELLSEFVVPLTRGLVEVIRNVRELFALFKRDEFNGAPLPMPVRGKTPEQLLAEKHDAAKAQREMQKLLAAQQVEVARNAVGLGALGDDGFIGSRGEPRKNQSDLLDEQFAARFEKLDKLRASNLISEQEFKDQQLVMAQQLAISRAQLAVQGMADEQEAMAKRTNANDAEVVRVQRRYADIKDSVRARYDYEIARAIEAGEATEEIERRKEAAVARVQQASNQAQFEASLQGQLMLQGFQTFSQGISANIVNGFRTGKFAFADFFSSFMAQIAQMILQALILRTLMAAFGAAFGGAATGGTQGGWSGGLGTTPAMAAEGGIIPRKMALGGIQTVNTATYLPRFNAIAGEAGSEVLAVLSRPRFMEIGGLASYVGSVQGQRVAMTNADDLARSAGGRGGAGGTIVVEVRGTRDFEARVIDSSIEGAVVRVVNDLHQDGPMSNAVKGLTS